MAQKKITNQYTTGSKVLTCFFAVLCLVWVMPIFEVVINSFKANAFVALDPFALPNSESFSGFDNYKIEGFETAAVYMPMIGSIPFIGYVFNLGEGADVNAFIKNLTDNANPAWNICVTADQVVAGAFNNTVFFLMCPATFEA